MNLRTKSHRRREPPADQPHASASESRKFLNHGDYILRAWAAVLIVAAVDCVWAWRAGFTIGGIPQLLRAVAMLAAIGFFFEYTGRAKWVSDGANYLALWIALAVALNIYSYAVATLRLPMWDVQFARMDAALGFHWTALLSLITPHRIPVYLLEHAYNSILVQLFASIGYFAVFGHRDRNRELLWIGMLSAMVTISLSGLFPAIGPYTKEMPKWSAILVTIRNGNLTRFTLGEMAGIVTFPSFHTVMAVFLIYVHRPPLRSFIPVAIVNAAMLVAIPFAGHHYLVDVIAGACVAVVSILIVRAAMGQGSLREAPGEPAMARG